MVHCDSINAEKLCPGKEWFHQECIILKDKLEMVEKFICKDCEERTQFKTTYKSTSPASDEHYDVEKILDHGKYDDGSSGFLVKWVGHHSREATWVLEEDLGTCYQLVVDFRRKHNLSPTKLRPVAGCSLSQDPEVKYNINNWNTCDQVEKAFVHFTKHEKYQTDLPMAAVLFEDFQEPNQDHLLVILLDSHFYSILWLQDERLAILLDGRNLCQTETVKRKFKSVFKDRKLRTFNCLDSFRVDHCGSAAVLGCMELARLYKYGQLEPQEITFQPFLKTRIIAHLHPEKSNPYPGRIKIQDRKLVWTCEICQQFSTKKGKKSLQLHQRNCHSKQ